MGLSIVLIRPPSGINNQVRGKSSLPSLGQCYLATELRKHGHFVQLLDADIEDDLQLNPDTQLIGIGPCLSTSFWRAIDLASDCRRICPTATIILGGPHFNTSPLDIIRQTIQRFSFVDYVCRGEGETVLVDLAKTLNQGGLISESESIDNRILYSKTPVNITKQDFPARDLLQKYEMNYQAAARRQAHRDTCDLSPTTMMASRGCPYNCVFCCSKKCRRLRSPESIVDEMEHCTINHGSRFFIFFDDLFAAPTTSESSRIRTFCQQLHNRIPEALWEVELRADVICNMGEETLAKMYSAGCRIINIGFEKGYQRGLDKLRKDQTLEDAIAAVAILRSSGDYIINGTFIIGGEEETEQQAYSTIEMPIQLGLDNASFAPLTVHPGTDLYNMALNAGSIVDYWTDYNRTRTYPLYLGKYLSEKQAFFLVSEGYRRFYFRKEYIMKRFCEAQTYKDYRDLLTEFSYWLKRADDDTYYINSGHCT
jgi:radical SAM superfamily enzyme YgiQ (UPF0313 family)